MRFRPLESDVFANDDARDAVKEHCAAAHGARRKRGIQRALPVNGSPEPAGVFQAVHFRMMNDAAALHPLVVAASNDSALANQHRTDGNAALRQAFPGLGDRGLEEGIHADQIAATMASPISRVPSLRTLSSAALKMSPVRQPAAMAFPTASSNAQASSSSPKLWRNINAAERIWAMGLARFLPAISGAVPPAGS